MVFHALTAVLYLLVAMGVATIPMFFVFLPSFYGLFLDLWGVLVVRLTIKKRTT